MNTITKQTFPLIGLHCASCAVKVEKLLNQQEGVEDSVVNLAAASVLIEYNTSLKNPETLRKILKKAGYELIIENDDYTADKIEETNKSKYKKLKAHTIAAILFSIPVAIIGMFFMNMPYANYIMLILTTPVLFYYGKDFFINAWKQLKIGSANMDTLVALSTGIAYFFSVFNLIYPKFWTNKGLEAHVYFEAAAVIISFILLGRLLEDKAKGNTTSAIKKLMGLQPKTVNIIDDNGIEKVLSINEIKKDDTIIVKPGERIAVDGIVSLGESYIDESMLSGEPIAALKQVNSKVFAGTINQKGSFRFTAEKVGKDTMLAHIIHLVKEAQGSKAKIQKLTDKIASFFVPIIIIISILTLILWVVLQPTNGLSYGLLAMVTVLIIACPCALGLATPTAVMVAIGKAAESGILIKDAESLISAHKINAVVLDKTGTITEGKPFVTDIIWAEDNEKYADIFLSIEKHSEHPLADAIVNHLADFKVQSVESFESITAKGVKGSVNGKMYFSGNTKFMEENNISLNNRCKNETLMWQVEAKTIIWFANSKEVLAAVAISDKIKEGSVQAIKELKDKGIEVYMLTGDNEQTAKHIAKNAGIDSYKSEVLPNKKAAFIEALQAKGKFVAMVGDGINDSAALAKANISIAMGKGSDIAMDVANMTIISSDLRKISAAIKLSKLSVRTIKQNLFWAFIYNLIGIPLAAGVLYPISGFMLNPMIAGAAMALSSVSVVSNSLRLKRQKC